MSINNLMKYQKLKTKAKYHRIVINLLLSHKDILMNNLKQKQIILNSMKLNYNQNN